jgi:hypothetical protein
MIYTRNKLITLDSKFGIQQNGTYKSNLLFNFRNLLSDEQHYIKSEVVVLNAQIPISFYVINEYNNVLTISGSGILTTSITADPGNYDANTLITELKSKFLAAGITFSTIKINRNTGRLIFTAFIFTNYQFSGSMIGILGTTTTVISVSTVYKCIYPLNLLGIQKLSIRSDAFAVQSVSSVDFSFSNILITIPVDMAPFSMISYSSQLELNKNLLNVRLINEIDIKIYDENNNLVNFNNLDWNITLVITSEIKYDQPDISLNNILNKNVLELQKKLEPPIEDYTDRRIDQLEERQGFAGEINNPPENPIKLQNQKELDLLNY